MAEQDNLVDDTQENDVVNMLNLSGNSDLIKGVYEGGFKTWECSIDMVQYLSGLPEEQITNKRVLEVRYIYIHIYIYIYYAKYLKYIHFK